MEGASLGRCVAPGEGRGRPRRSSAATAASSGSHSSIASWLRKRINGEVGWAELVGLGD